MNLTPADLNALCELAIEAAKAAGRYVRKTRPVTVDHKSNSGSLASQVVTEVDQESQKRILAVLEPSFAHYDLGLLTEERSDDGSRLVKDHFWCIDPIDGTLNFIEGIPGYAVSIALVSHEGIPYIGVVYDPITQVIYHAIRDGGAFRDSALWRPDLSPSERPLKIFTDRSEVKRSLFEPTARAMKATWGTYGGGVMNALWCLENSPSCYFKFAKPGNGGGCFWDFAATSCIYTEVGAWATDINGATLNLNRADSIYLNRYGILFATHSKIAQQLLDLN